MIKKEACPSCRQAGGDTSGDNLARYPDGHAYCFACGYRESGGKGYDPVVFPRLTFECTYLLDKGITVDTCEAWGVRTVAKKKRDGTIYDTGFIAFPYVEGHKLRNRSAEVHHGAKKHETITYRGEPGLFGMHILKGTKDLVIVEGETDALYMWQCLGGSTDVLGIPGAKLARLLGAQRELLEQYERIIVFGDSDSVGESMVQDVLGYLPLLSGYIGRYPHKDACECSADELLTAVKNAEEVPSSLLTGKALVEAYREAKSKRRDDLISTGIPCLDELLVGGLCQGDLVGLLGNTGVGKSTLASYVAYSAMLQGHRVLYVATEMRADGVIDTFKLFAEDDGDDFLEHVSQHLIMVDDTTDFNRLMEVGRAAVKKRDVRLVVIDVLQDIDGFSEWQYARKVMGELEDFALGDSTTPGVAVILVTHTKYVEGRIKKKLDRSSIAGGVSVSQKMTTIIGIEGDEYDSEEDDEPSSTRRLRVVKRNRYRRTTKFVGDVQFTGSGYRQVQKQAGGERPERAREAPTRRRKRAL